MGQIAKKSTHRSNFVMVVFNRFAHATGPGSWEKDQSGVVVGLVFSFASTLRRELCRVLAGLSETLWGSLVVAVFLVWGFWGVLGGH